MADEFALGSFLARWGGRVRYDLSASESATLTLSTLLDLAGDEDLRRWRELDLSYADPKGALWLRATVAARHDGLDADHVVCCAGAQEGLACITRALLGPDDHAVVVLPIYQPTERAVTTLCEASGVALDGRADWRLDIDQVAAALRPNTRLILTNFPNSPTGAAIDPATLASLVDLCRRRGIWLVNDEVYRLVGSDTAPHPPQVADCYERGISINAVSKGFGLPGLRVGWVACQDRDLLARVLLAKSALSSCLAAPSEVLAHIALRAEATIVGRNHAIAQANQQLLQAFLCRHPEWFAAYEANTATLAFPRYLGADGADRFAARLMREAGILLLPSSLWRSPLADLPMDRLRIGLGHAGVQRALAALDAYLTRCSCPVAAE